MCVEVQSYRVVSSSTKERTRVRRCPDSPVGPAERRHTTETEDSTTLRSRGNTVANQGSSGTLHPPVDLPTCSVTVRRWTLVCVEGSIQKDRFHLVYHYRPKCLCPFVLGTFPKSFRLLVSYLFDILDDVSDDCVRTLNLV